MFHGYQLCANVILEAAYLNINVNIDANVDVSGSRSGSGTDTDESSKFQRVNNFRQIKTKKGSTAEQLAAYDVKGEYPSPADPELAKYVRDWVYTPSVAVQAVHSSFTALDEDEDEDEDKEKSENGNSKEMERAVDDETLYAEKARKQQDFQRRQDFQTAPSLASLAPSPASLAPLRLHRDK